MYEVVGANRCTGRRFSRFFDAPKMAYIYKKALEHSPTAEFVAIWKH
jgi:hypothetical protein